MHTTLKIVEKEKDDTIRGLLSKLHRSDNDMAESITTMNETIRNRQKTMQEANARRQSEANDKLAELASVRYKNSNLEAEIEKWEDYLNDGSKEHDRIIKQLESKIAEQTNNTESMNDFILKQIDTAKTGLPSNINLIINN